MLCPKPPSLSPCSHHCQQGLSEKHIWGFGDNLRLTWVNLKMDSWPRCFGYLLLSSIRLSHLGTGGEFFLEFFDIVLMAQDSFSSMYQSKNLTWLSSLNSHKWIVSKMFSIPHGVFCFVFWNMVSAQHQQNCFLTYKVFCLCNYTR